MSSKWSTMPKSFCTEVTVKETFPTFRLNTAAWSPPCKLWPRLVLEHCVFCGCIDTGITVPGVYPVQEKGSRLHCVINEVLICPKQWTWLKDLDPSVCSAISWGWNFSRGETLTCHPEGIPAVGVLVKTLSALSRHVFIHDIREWYLNFLPTTLDCSNVQKVIVNFKALAI